LETPADLGSGYFKKAYELGSRISSNSWGGENVDYSTECRQIDDFVWKNPDFIIAYAAGNAGDKGYGSVGAPANAKNIISVGASRSTEKSFSEGGYLSGIQVIGHSDLSVHVGLASFGPKFQSLSYFEKPIVLANPIDACSELRNSKDVAGNIVLIRRGTCYFDEKTLNAQKAGAFLVLIFNDKAGDVGGMSSSGKRNVQIPCSNFSWISFFIHI
jgi:hypothetical protein